MYELRNVSLGMWVDLPKSMVLAPEFFSWFCEELQFDLMSIVIDDTSKSTGFSWGPGDVEKVLRLADPHRVEVGLMTWPYPVMGLMNRMKEDMGELLSVGPVAEWETDSEVNWASGEVRGFHPHRDETIEDGSFVIHTRSAAEVAKEYLYELKCEVCAAHSVRNTMTMFTYHVEDYNVAQDIGECDLVMAQAYSVSERDKRPIYVDHRLGPGRAQLISLDRAVAVPGVASGLTALGVGHAAWGQTGFRHNGPNQAQIVKPEDAMRAAVSAACEYPIVVIDHRWWSARFCYPRSKWYNSYADAFLRTLRP